jgi:hypothetical protein
MSIPILLKQPYLAIPILHEDNLGDNGNPIQKATNSYFMKIFQLQCLLGQNCPSIKVQSGSERSVDAQSIENVVSSLHTKT